MWNGSAWRRLPDTGQSGSYGWLWAEGRLVCIYLDTSGDGIPAGGRLDPVTGVWDRIPGEPASGTGTFLVTGASGTVVAGWGWLYDDATEKWAAVPDIGFPLDSPARVLTGDVIVVVGGLDTTDGYLNNEAGLSNDVWVGPLLPEPGQVRPGRDGRARRSGTCAKVVRTDERRDMSELQVVATIPAKPGSEDAIRDVLAKLVTATRDEDGCVGYELFESGAAPGTFVTVERWRDQAALDVHLGGPAIAAAFADAGPHLAGEVAIHPLLPVG